MRSRLKRSICNWSISFATKAQKHKKRIIPAALNFLREQGDKFHFDLPKPVERDLRALLAQLSKSKSTNFQSPHALKTENILSMGCLIVVLLGFYAERVKPGATEVKQKRRPKERQEMKILNSRNLFTLL